MEKLNSELMNKIEDLISMNNAIKHQNKINGMNIENIDSALNDLRFKLFSSQLEFKLKISYFRDRIRELLVYIDSFENCVNNTNIKEIKEEKFAKCELKDYQLIQLKKDFIDESTKFSFNLDNITFLKKFNNFNNSRQKEKFEMEIVQIKKTIEGQDLDSVKNEIELMKINESDQRVLNLKILLKNSAFQLKKELDETKNFSQARMKKTLPTNNKNIVMTENESIKFTKKSSINFLEKLDKTCEAMPIVSSTDDCLKVKTELKKFEKKNFTKKRTAKTLSKNIFDPLTKKKVKQNKQKKIKSIIYHHLSRISTSLNNDLDIKENVKSASQNFTEMTCINFLFLKDILLNLESKQCCIESQEKTRRKLYLNKKRIIERKKAKNLYEKPEFLTNEQKIQTNKQENQIQYSQNKLIEAKKEKLESEQQGPKDFNKFEQVLLVKEQKAKMAEEKAKKNKLAIETEIRKKEKEEKQINSFDQIPNVDENKAGINMSTFEMYNKIEKMFNQIRKESEDALNVKELKLYKFELQKAINFPLNSLIEANFQEKIKTLLLLLSGQACKVTSTITVDTTKHPKAIDFCLVYLGRKIVEKGEETVASRPEMALKYVQVIMEIVKAYRDFETILMGQLQERCPYILPFYKPRNSAHTDEQYYKSIGYKLIDGKIEEDEFFYKRMSGVFYLYFTLLLTGNNSFFSIQRAWQWLADVLNMTPRPNITAEMLTIFFKCCGYTLQKVYGKQFLKLVIICQKDYLKLIKSISSEKQSKASIVRLVNVLEHFQKNGLFDQ